MKLSVVMAVYNGASYVEQAINSILGQTYGHFEFIIVDDGSTDDTWSRLTAITDHRVKPYRLPSNRGTPYALNRAVLASRGDWIAVQDADDISLPDRLAVQTDYIREHPGLAAVGSLIACIGEEGTDPARLRRIEANLNYAADDGEELFANRYLVCPLCHGSAVYSKAQFISVGGYETAYPITHDYDLWLKLFRLGTIEKINRVLYNYRVHPASLSHRNATDTYAQKLLCSLRRLCEYEYGGIPGLVRLIVFGSETLCRLVRKRVVPQCRVTVHSYFSQASYADSALNLWNSGEADGIVLLKSEYRSDLVDYFLSGGMTMNGSLFRL